MYFRRQFSPPDRCAVHSQEARVRDKKWVWVLFHLCLAIFGIGFTSPVTTAAPVTRLTLLSEAGDFIGGGNVFTCGKLLEASTNSESGERGVNQIYLVFEVDHLKDLSVAITFSSKRMGVPLLPGFYENAQSLVSGDFGYPGINISMGSRACNQVFGKFTILAVTYDTTVFPPKVTSLAATFEQGCEQPNNKLIGTIFFNAEPQGFDLEATPSECELYKGQSKKIPIRTTPINLTGETVHLQVSSYGSPSLPAKLKENILTVGESTQLEIKPPDRAVFGIYLVSVGGAGGRQFVDSESILVNFLPKGSFQLRVIPQMVSVEAGESASVKVKVKPINGFSEYVELNGAVSPVGSQIRISINGAAFPGRAHRIEIKPDKTVLPGNYTVKIYGACGTVTDEIEFPLVITAPGN